MPDESRLVKRAANEVQQSRRQIIASSERSERALRGSWQVRPLAHKNTRTLRPQTSGRCHERAPRAQRVRPARRQGRRRPPPPLHVDFTQAHAQHSSAPPAFPQGHAQPAQSSLLGLGDALSRPSHPRLAARGHKYAQRTRRILLAQTKSKSRPSQKSQKRRK
jgi:hypothetical protein